MFDAQETRDVINSLTAINNEALVIDLDAVDDAALIDTLHAYRVQRPETRIIIYALGRCPGRPFSATAGNASPLARPHQKSAKRKDWVQNGMETRLRYIQIKDTGCDLFMKRQTGDE
jgi:hypothetical protein